MVKLSGNLILTIAGGVIAVLLAFFVWWTLTEPGRQKAKANVAVAGRTVAEGDAKASDAAVGAVIAQGERAADREKISQENEDDIRSQPGGSTPFDPGVNAAQLRSLCKRPAYAGSRRCLQLPGSGAAKVP